jgi:hypothetical protein
MHRPRPVRLTALLRRARRSRRSASETPVTLAAGVAAIATRDAGTPDGNAGGCAPPNAPRIAAEIGAATLELAKQANGTGLTMLGYLLEMAALEAGAEAALSAWPADMGRRRAPVAAYSAATALISIRNSSRTSRSIIKSVLGG